MKLGYAIHYVEDVARTMDFYEKAFGLKKAFMHENQYGEMATGETKLGFANHETASSHGFEYAKSSLQQLPGAFEIGFVTTDVEKVFQQAVSAGAKPVSAPRAKP